MKYFDFVMSEVHGLRVKELLDAKAEGRKVIGSYCTFVPEELILAFDGVSVGLCTGADFATDLVEQVLPRNTCSLIKSAFGFIRDRSVRGLKHSSSVCLDNSPPCSSWDPLWNLTERLVTIDEQPGGASSFAVFPPALWPGWRGRRSTRGRYTFPNGSELLSHFFRIDNHADNTRRLFVYVFRHCGLHFWFQNVKDRES